MAPICLLIPATAIVGQYQRKDVSRVEARWQWLGLACQRQVAIQGNYICAVRRSAYYCGKSGILCYMFINITAHFSLYKNYIPVLPIPRVIVWCELYIPQVIQCCSMLTVGEWKTDWQCIVSRETSKSSAVQCSAVQCSAVQCSAVQCSAVQCIMYEGQHI
jgi:hypothetical protein